MSCRKAYQRTLLEKLSCNSGPIIAKLHLNVKNFLKNVGALKRTSFHCEGAALGMPYGIVPKGAADATIFIPTEA